MKTTSSVVLWVVLALIAACGGDDSKSPREQLIGSWVNTHASGDAGLDLQFKDDGTYVVQVLQFTSTTSANDEVESGVYSATDSVITCTPQKCTCPGPVPVYQLTYTFNGDSLGVLFSTGVFAFSRYSGPAATNFSLTLGCFQSDGSFVPSPLAPVSN